MALNIDTEKTVAAGVVVFRTEMGVVAKKEGDNGDTVKLPAHVAKFFQDKGLVS